MLLIVPWVPGAPPGRCPVPGAALEFVVGDEADLDDGELLVGNVVWADQPFTGEVMVQCSAHGTAIPACFEDGTVRWRVPQRRVAPGQSVVFFDPTNRYVLGGGIVQ